MTTGLKNQVHMYSLDTSAFYHEDEKKIHRKLLKCYNHRNKLREIKDLPKERMDYIRGRIGRLKGELKEKLALDRGIRQLDEDQLRENNIISVFSSVLTRTIGVKTDELTDKLFTVRAFYFEVLKDLIEEGFIYKGEKYVYFSSSAGQIRTKKGVWIKEVSWNEHSNSLTCGLSVKEINNQGGSNINRYLSYVALTNSASVHWKSFDINKSIVVEDLETNVSGLVDFIDRDSYEIERKKMGIPIEHSDGAGMILPNVNKRSFMIRMPFVKGLMVPFPFDEFAKEHGKSKVVDIYGKEWDIFEDGIEIIFTRSQFKMYKYYKDWEEYKNNFNEYRCQAAKLNEEDKVFSDVKLNYQMVQTLTDITDDELTQIASDTSEDILNIGRDKETMLRVLGVTEGNRNKNHFQQALELYPELLNDIHAKEVIRDVKSSLVRNAKAGRLNISGKYTFICPDFYAVCERLFLGTEQPKGLLKDGEVYCNLYDEGKVDMLRSPHLYREHGVKMNVIDKEKEKWFISAGIYTSIHDTVSKMLQFDKSYCQTL